MIYLRAMKHLLWSQQIDEFRAHAVPPTWVQRLVLGLDPWPPLLIERYLEERKLLVESRLQTVSSEWREPASLPKTRAYLASSIPALYSARAWWETPPTGRFCTLDGMQELSPEQYDPSWLSRHAQVLKSRRI